MNKELNLEKIVKYLNIGIRMWRAILRKRVRGYPDDWATRHFALVTLEPVKVVPRPV